MRHCDMEHGVLHDSRVSSKRSHVRQYFPVAIQSRRRLRQDGGKNHVNNRGASPSLIIQRGEMAAFFRLFDDDLIQDFLWMDSCFRLSDKYLLAMVFSYFKRAGFKTSEYSRTNFFLALYLANDMEEDEEEFKYDIFPWALGHGWRKSFPEFLKWREELWARMDYRAAVSWRCCKEVMAIAPNHNIWQRERLAHHSGAERSWRRADGQPVAMLGPQPPPGLERRCVLCTKKLSVVHLDASSSSSSSSASPSSSSASPSSSSASPCTLNLLDLFTTEHGEGGACPTRPPHGRRTATGVERYSAKDNTQPPWVLECGTKRRRGILDKEGACGAMPVAEPCAWYL